MKDKDVISLIKETERLGIRKGIIIHPYPHQIYGIDDPVPNGCLKMASVFKQEGIQGNIKVKRMRYMEKKFRAWNKKSGWYLNFDEPITIEKLIHGINTKEFIDDLEFEQYSGLNDSEKAEFYENDLAQHKDGEGPIFTIKLYSGCFWATLPKQYGYVERPLHQLNHLLKVVGNIHQNEDLLKLNDT
jgi:hypothetical protein